MPPVRCRYRDRRRNDRADVEALRSACGGLLNATPILVLGLRTARKAMIARSGFNEGLDVVTGIRSAIDPLEFGDWLTDRVGPVIEAQASIWLLCDPQTIVAANRLTHLVTGPRGHGHLAAGIKIDPRTAGRGGSEN
jgi:hypothetical protein